MLSFGRATFVASVFGIFFASIGNAQTRPTYKYPDGYEQQVLDLEKKTIEYTKDETYGADVRIALPPKQGSKVPRLVRYGDLDKMSQDLYRLKIGEMLMLSLQQSDVHFSEDAAKISKELSQAEKKQAGGGDFITTIGDLRKRNDKILEYREQIVSLRRSYAKSFHAFAKTATTEHAGKLPLSFQKYPRTIRVWTSKAGLLDEPDEKFFQLERGGDGRFRPLTEKKPALESK